MKWLTRIALTVALLMMVAATALAQEPIASVNTGALNVRTGPGLTYPSFRALPYGFGVLMVGRNEDTTWIMIRFTDNGQEGWISAGMIFTGYRLRDLPITAKILTAPTPTGSVTGILGANIHRDALSTSPVLAVLPLNDPLVLLGRNFNSLWAKVQTSGGVVGWIESRFVSTNVPIRSLNPADGGVTAPIAPLGTSSNFGTGGPVTVANYTVVAGDTLASIATRYGTTIEKLMQANSITNANRIFTGQKLVIVR